MSTHELEQQVEEARGQIQKQQEQIVLLSQHKQSFLDNMSIEMRTPLNTAMLLSKTLADNAEGRLSEKEQKFAQTIYASAQAQLNLVNALLKVSKPQQNPTGQSTTTPTSGAACHSNSCDTLQADDNRRVDSRP
jgi:signal transduction histidine kinase